MIAIVDYGMGNLRSVAKAVEKVGGRAEVVTTAEGVLAAEKVILPGVGALPDAMTHLRSQGLIEAIERVVAEDRPFLGICLGLQLLFEVGYEDGEHAALGLLAGEVVRFDMSGVAGADDLAVPHMGWNTIHWEGSCPLLAGVAQGSHVYFVHSYHVVPAAPAPAIIRTEYGYPFAAGVWRGNLFATQFHPEKSQAVGLKMLSNFVALPPGGGRQKGQGPCKRRTAGA